MPTFRTPSPITVTVEVLAADIWVIASDRSDTTVEVRPRSNAKPADVRAAAETRVEFADGRLIVRGHKPKPLFGFGRSEALDITIALPTGSHFNAETYAGPLRAEGRLGDCRCSIGVDGVQLDQVAALEVVTGVGDIAVTRVAGRLEVSTGSGSIRIGDVGGSATVQSANGAIRLGHVAGEIRVTAANGDITIEGAGSSVIAKTAYGSIRVGEIVRGAVLLETASGGIDVGIREGTAAWLDVRSGYGRILNALRPDDGTSPAKETAEIRAHTGYGDIVVGRSAGKPQPGKSAS